MGGAQSSEKVQTKYEEKINIITNVEENEDEIFSKISDLTKEILLKYSDMHLDENFCNNLAIIYQNKLDTFKIKLLRDMYDKISGKKVQHELLLVNKYNDKDDDKFKVEDDLKVGIEELFFNQNIKFNPSYLSSIELFDPNLKIDDIFKKTITNKKYIDNLSFSNLLDNNLLDNYFISKIDSNLDFDLDSDFDSDSNFDSDSDSDSDMFMVVWLFVSNNCRNKHF